MLTSLTKLYIQLLNEHLYLNIQLEVILQTQSWFVAPTPNGLNNIPYLPLSLSITDTTILGV